MTQAAISQTLPLLNFNAAFLEILASKICHDLISPVGAIHNGLEIIQDFGGAPDPEVLAMISASAAQASARLQAFRMAYGQGGAENNIRPADVHHLITSYLAADGKIRQDWSPDQIFFQEETPRAFCKILAGGLLLMSEALPRGGALSVTGTGTGADIIARGPQAGLFTAQIIALETPESEAAQEPRAAHALIFTLLSRHYGYNIVYNPQSDEACLYIRG
jgi:histidine phosphotransferase ChpT